MRIFFHLIAIISLSLLFACNKDKVTIRRIPDNVHRILPYVEGQAIRFVSNNGNSLTSKVTLKTEIIGPFISNGETFKVETMSYKLMMGTQPLVEGSIDNNYIVFMNIWSPEDNYKKGVGFDFYTDQIAAKPLCSGPRQTCVSMVTLNGKTFNDVLKIENGSSYSPYDYLSKAWFSVDKGLIGFQYYSGTTYVKE